MQISQFQGYGSHSKNSEKINKNNNNKNGEKSPAIYWTLGPKFTKK
jgi:hypothetical protein